MTTMNKDLRSKSEWIEVFPFGVTMGPGQIRPVMIFKDKTETRVLPVWLSPMDAGIAVTQSATRLEGSPHDLSWQILSMLGVELERCLFRELRGHHQYVELQFKGSRKLKSLKARADDAISFCLHAGCQFFATIDYMERSRVLETRITDVTLAKENVNPHPYLN